MCEYCNDVLGESLHDAIADRDRLEEMIRAILDYKGTSRQEIVLNKIEEDYNNYRREREG